MNNKLRTLTLVSLFLGAFASASPLYAKAKPSPDHNMMMKGGNMDMMGMMGMMEQMTKMMGLCNKMMETAMNNKDGSDMKMPMDGDKAPEKKK